MGHFGQKSRKYESQEGEKERASMQMVERDR